MENNKRVVNGPTPKLLWRVFFILLITTAFEFLVAFTVDVERFKFIKISLFVIMTFIKAWYILAVFMHVKYEDKIFKLALSVYPVLLMIWFVVALFMEGDYFGIQKLF